MNLRKCSNAERKLQPKHTPVKKRTSRKVKTDSARTYRKDKPPSSEVSAAVFGSLKFIFGYVGQGLKSYCSSYKELAVGVKDFVKDTAVGVLNKGASWLNFFRRQSDASNDNVIIDRPQRIKTGQNDTEKDSSSGTANTNNNNASNSQRSTRHKEEGLKIAADEFKELLPEEAAKLLLSKIAGFLEADNKVILMLEGLARGETIELASKHFCFSSKRIGKASKKKLIGLLVQLTKDQKLAKKIAEIVFAQDSKNDHVIKVGDLEEKATQPLQPDVVVEVETSKPPQREPDVVCLPGPQVCEAKQPIYDELTLAYVKSMLSQSTNPDLLSCEGQIIDFLSSKKADALKRAQWFIRDIVQLDLQGAKGAVNFLKQAAQANPESHFIYYVKAEAALSLLRQFDDFAVRMEIANPNKDDRHDIEIETKDTMYLIKIKTSFRSAIKSIRELEFIAQRAHEHAARARAEHLFGASKGKMKPYVPVCVVNGAGDTINALAELSSEKIMQMKAYSNADSIEDLLAIGDEYRSFELWDINGKNIGPRLHSLLTVKPELRLFGGSVA